MKVVVSNETGELFSYDTSQNVVMPQGDLLPEVLGALEEAARHINTVHAGHEGPSHPAA